MHRHCRYHPRRVRFFNISKIIIPRQSYNEAIAWYEKGHYDTAKSIFKQLGDYKDSSKRYKECAYLKADEDYKDEDYNAARAAFVKLGNYKDSPQRSSDCAYLEVVKLGESGYLKAALDYIKETDLQGTKINKLKSDIKKALKLSKKEKTFVGVWELKEAKGTSILDGKDFKWSTGLESFRVRYIVSDGTLKLAAYSQHNTPIPVSFTENKMTFEKDCHDFSKGTVMMFKHKSAIITLQVGIYTYKFAYEKYNDYI